MSDPEVEIVPDAPVADVPEVEAPAKAAAPAFAPHAEDIPVTEEAANLAHDLPYVGVTEQYLVDRPDDDPRLPRAAEQ